jgi:hypothetical protein
LGDIRNKGLGKQLKSFRNVVNDLMVQLDRGYRYNPEASP